MIISLSGASGTGKSTTISRLTRSSKKYRRLRSITTRPPRSDDVVGEVDCVTPQEFTEISTKGNFAWELDIYGYRYGSLRADLISALEDSSSVLLCDVGSDAVNEIRNIVLSLHKTSSSYHPVYLMAPNSRELTRRLTERGANQQEIARRLERLKSHDRRESASGKYHLQISAELPQETVCRIIASLVDTPEHASTDDWNYE